MSTPKSGGTSLLARVGWVVVTLLTVGLDLFAIPAVYAQAQIGCNDQTRCTNGLPFTAAQVAQLRAHGVALHVIGTYTVILDTIPTLVCVALATLIYWRRADDRMALFCAYMLVTFGGGVIGDAMGSLQGMNAVLFLLATTVQSAGQIALVVFLCVFPDGRFTPRWTIWLALIQAIPWLGAYFPDVRALDILATIRNGPYQIIIVMLLLVVAQIYRYQRVSTERQRQQTKWVVYGITTGLGLFVTILFVGNVILNEGAHENGQGQFTISAVFTGLLLLIPISISVAILRSRLYGIDIIIRRTLIYGSLTAILAGVYYLGVVGAERVVSQITGKAAGQQPVAIVLTTLALFALFQPLRHGLQRVIDRRFYRGKYDAERALASFGSALRGEVDLDHLSQRLTAVVEDTMRPATLSLWLRPAKKESERRGEGLTP